MPGQDDRLVVLGVITGAHGIRGEVKVKSFTDDPEAIWHYGPLLLDGGQELNVKQFRPQKALFVAAFEEVTNRNAAEALKGKELMVERDRLPEAEEGEFYHSDLVGLSVRNVEATEIGSVVSVQNFGAGDLVEVKLKGQKATVLLPFDEASVPEVDLEKGFLVVDPPEGLLE